MNAATFLHGTFSAIVLVIAAGTVLRMARAARRLRRGRGALPPGALPDLHTAFMPPVSLLLPAEEPPETLVARVQALLGLDFPEYEIVVVLDPGQAETLAALQSAFGLRVFPEAHWRRLKGQPVRAIYHSAHGPRLRVVDKEPGDAADALNCAVNASRFPLVGTLGPATVLREDALLRLAEPFVEDTRTRAACAPVVEAHASAGRELLALRGIIAGMSGSTLRALALSPRGAILFRKDAVVECNGFRAIVDPHTDLLRRLARAGTDGLAASVRFVAEPLALREDAIDEEKRPSVADGEAVAMVAALAGATALWATGAIATGPFVAFIAMAIAFDWLASSAALALEAAYFERLVTRSPLARLVLAAISVPPLRRFLPGRGRSPT